MEIKAIEEKNNSFVFELDRSHGFCNMLKEELWNDKKVKIATYTVRHPLVNKPEVIVETDGTNPRKVLIDAANRLKKKIEKFEKDFIKEVK